MNHAHPRTFGARQMWNLMSDSGAHIGTLYQNEYGAWSECSCGWATTGRPTKQNAYRAFGDHKGENKPRAQRKDMGPTFDTYARADAKISRCTCGAWMWEGECATHTIINQREARRLNQMEVSK